MSKNKESQPCENSSSIYKLYWYSTSLVVSSIWGNQKDHNNKKNGQSKQYELERTKFKHEEDILFEQYTTLKNLEILFVKISKSYNDSS